MYFEPKLRASLSPASSNNNFLSDCKGSVYQIKYATSSDSSDDDTDDYQQPMGKKINVTPEERASFDSLRRNIPALAQHERDWSPERAETTVRSMTAMVPNSLTGAKEALISSTREQLAQCLSTVNVMQPAPPTNLSLLIQRKNLPSSPVPRPFKERMVSNVAIRRQDHETSNIIVIDTFAWMIVLGDALLNFIDGLSIGAAFDRNILAGMSISVAVMLEEVNNT